MRMDPFAFSAQELTDMMETGTDEPLKTWMLKRFNGNQKLALAGYNAGEASVVEYNGVPPYAETQSYVNLVQSLTERYRNDRFP